MPTSARSSRQKFHEETPGQTEAVPEAGQPLIIGHFALQIVEAVEKIQPEGGADLVVACAPAALDSRGLDGNPSACYPAHVLRAAVGNHSFYQHPTNSVDLVYTLLVGNVKGGFGVFQ